MGNGCKLFVGLVLSAVLGLSLGRAEEGDFAVRGDGQIGTDRQPASLTTDSESIVVVIWQSICVGCNCFVETSKSPRDRSA